MNMDMVERLKSLGMNEKEVRILFALEKGELSSTELERVTGLRQPEVSRTVRDLRVKGYVEFVRAEKKFKRGAPCKYWRLTKPLKEIIKEVVSRKLIELDKKLRTCVQILFEYGEPISNIDPEIAKAIMELKDPTVVIELRGDGNANVS
jgi:predicted transcriptional regulator